jgi:hypothetical protein
MTDHPILFSAPMIRALLAGHKTQTRRLLGRGNTLFDGRKWQNKVADDDVDFATAWIDQGPSPAGNPGPYLKARWSYGKIYHPPSTEILVSRLYPRIQLGDRLWVKETWRTTPAYDDLKPSDLGGDEPLNFVANDGYFNWREADGDQHGKARVSIFMPRWASRLTLTVTEVRIERLQDISRGDAMDEGCPFPNMQAGPNPVDWYRDLWEQIAGGGSWEKNPWVLAYTFTVEQRNIDNPAAIEAQG